MKKFWEFALSLLVMLLPVLSFSAQAEEINIDFSSSHEYESILDMVFVDEDLYMLTPYGLYRLEAENPSLVIDLAKSQKYMRMDEEPGEERASNAWRRAISDLFTDGQSVYGLQPYSGDIYRIEANEMIHVQTVPYELLYASDGENDFYRGVRNTVCMNNALFLLLETDDQSNWDKTELIRFDLQSAEYVTCSPKYLLGIYPGQKDGLLVEMFDLDDDGKRIRRLWHYAPQEDAVQEHVTDADPAMAGGYLWHEKMQTFLYAASGQIMALNGPQEVLAYVPMTEGMGSAVTACSPDGQYAFAHDSFVFIRDLMMNSQNDHTVLRVYGNINPSTLTQFAVKYPNVSVVVVDTSSGMSLQEVLVSSNDQFDIYITQAPGLYTSMLDKDYCDAIESDVLLENVKKMYPAVQDALMHDGKMMAYPIDVDLKAWTVDQTVWNELGLGKIPSTYPDLFEAISTWKSEYAENNSNYILLDLQKDVAGYVEMVVKEYLLQFEGDDSVTFDSALFRSVLRTIIDHQDAFIVEKDQGELPIISSYMQGFGVSYNDDHMAVTIAPPSLDASIEQRVQGELKLAVLNPSSTQKEAATLFIEYMARTANVVTQYMLTPTLSEPVRYDGYQRRRQEMLDNIASLEEQLATADSDKAAPLQEMLENEKRMLAEANEKDWYISEEAISIYRAIGDGICIPYQSAFTNRDTFASIADIIDRYCSQGLDEASIDNFIQDLDRVVHMIKTESL